MTAPICSKCRQDISAADVNVATDVAFCRRCNVANSLSVLVHGAELDAVDVHDPITGTWLHATGQETLIGATHRSIAGALGTLAFSLFWNGVLSVFLLVVSISTLHHLGITVPDWFPAPKMNGNPMSIGATVFLWLFLTPFIVIGAGMAGACLLYLFGRTEVRIQQGEGSVFTGIGGLGWRRHFGTGAVQGVGIEEEPGNSNGATKISVVIRLGDDEQIKFGSMLRESRRKFVAAATRRALVGGGRS